MTTHLQEVARHLAGSRILVIGDIIVDHFIWGSVSRISPEAPVPVVNVNREELLLGGGANVLHNIYALGGEALLCGIVGADEMGGRLRELMADLGTSDCGLVVVDRPTTVKARVVAQGQQIVRFDREQVGDPGPEVVAALMRCVAEQLATVDAVVVSDYYKGVVSQALMEQLLDLVHRVSRESGRRIPVVVDPKPQEPERFAGATVMTPNHLEAERMAGMTIRTGEELARAAQLLCERFSCEAVLVTRGEAGMALLESGTKMVTIPTLAREVFDVTGAGDTVVAVLALALASGASLIDAASLANVAAGIVVGKVGTATVNMEELLVELQHEGEK